MPHIHELYDFTVSFFIVHPDKDKICLHWHKKLACWNQLGGHIELDEQPMESLQRELQEEAGLSPKDYIIHQIQKSPTTDADVDMLPVPFALPIYTYGKGSNHKHIDLPYIILANTDKLQPEEGESAEIGWFTLKDIDELYKAGTVETSTKDICEWVLQTVGEQR